MAMVNRTNHESQRPVKSGRFEKLLEKLVAVQTDLEPVCGAGTERVQVRASLDAIADACDVLRSAIADVRGFIYEANSLTERPEAVYG
jgi:hypothetical protein